MAKRKAKSTCSRSTSGWGQIALRGGEVLLGIAAGSAVAKAISQKDNVSGVDLLGLDGDTSGYVSTILTAALGAACIQFGKSESLRNIGLGCMIAGSTKLVNKVAGKSLISLSGTDDEQVFLPGIGDAEEYEYVEVNGPDALDVNAPNYVPTENAWQTSYNEPQLLTTPEVSGIGEPPIEAVGSVLL